MNKTPDSGQAALSAASKAATAQGLPMMDKIVVAIHGIGSQLRSDTIRSVAHRFGDRSHPPLPVMPLGFFNIGKTAEVRVSRLDAKPQDPLARIGFAEVFWADIPEQVVKANDTLEETKAWARTVVSRAEAAYRDNVPHGQLSAQDFQLGVGVVEEIVETVGVMENLLAVAAKAGLFKFDLAPLLRDYVGDVQLVTDFPFYREKIVYRFHSALAQIVKTVRQLYPGHTPEIYIVAHSEGTVISFLGLLEVLSGRVVLDPDPDPKQDTSPVPVDSSWIDCVRGYMTIGSPIDKHIVLWPKLWESMELQSHLDTSAGVVFEEGETTRLRLKQPIKWRNYYDYGDPIGFRLESAVALLHERDCKAFEFVTSKHDFGFSRYWLPGKAHTGYWQDPEVFGHFIDDVVLPSPQPPLVPKSRWLRGFVSTATPYLMAAMLHLGAVFVLFKAVTAFLTPDDAATSLALRETAAQVALLSLLLLGITVAARLPRLVKTKGWRWHGLALLLFGVAAVLNWFFLPDGVAGFLVQPLRSFASTVGLALGKISDAALLLTAAAVVASTGWWVPRNPRYGRRTLLGAGVLALLVMVAGRLIENSAQHPAWPVVLAGLAFLYLWWLGILLFDLTFIWHRYIRNSVAVETLRQWRSRHDAKPYPMMGLGRRPLLPTGETP